MEVHSSKLPTPSSTDERLQLFFDGNPDITNLVSQILTSLQAQPDHFANALSRLRRHLQSQSSSLDCSPELHQVVVELEPHLKPPLDILQLEPHITLNFRAGNHSADLLLIPLTEMIRSLDTILTQLRAAEDAHHRCLLIAPLQSCLDHYLQFKAEVESVHQRIHSITQLHHDRSDTVIDVDSLKQAQQECDTLLDRFRYARLNGAFLDRQYLVPQSLVRNVLSIDPKTLKIVKGDYANSNVVRRLDSVYYKTLEHGYPSIEAAVYLLSKLLFGGGVTPSLFLIFENVPNVDDDQIRNIFEAFPHLRSATGDMFDDPSFAQTWAQLIPSRSFFVNASLAVSTTSFAQHLENPEQFPVNPLSLSAMYFLSLLTSPNDAKDDNFMIDSDQNVIGVDNDLSFFKDWSSTEAHSRHVPLVSSIFFCMHDLAASQVDPKIVGCLKRNAGAIMHAWEILHNEYAEQYRRLHKEILTDPHDLELFESKCMTQISGKVLQVVSQRLLKVQAYLKLNASATHAQIFKELYPNLSKLYLDNSDPDPVKMLFEVHNSSASVIQTPCTSDQCNQGERFTREPFLWYSNSTLNVPPPRMDIIKTDADLRSALEFLVESNDTSRFSCRLAEHDNFVRLKLCDDAALASPLLYGNPRPMRLAHLLLQNIETWADRSVKSESAVGDGYLLDYLVRERMLCALHSCAKIGYKSVKYSSAFIEFFRQQDREFHCERCSEAFFNLESRNLKIAWEATLSLLCPVVPKLQSHASMTFSCAPLLLPDNLSPDSALPFSMIENRYFDPEIAGQLRSVLQEPSDRAMAFVTKGYHAIFVKMLPDYPLTELAVRCLSALLHGTETMNEIYPQVLFCSYQGLPMLIMHARGQFLDARRTLSGQHVTTSSCVVAVSKLEHQPLSSILEKYRIIGVPVRMDLRSFTPLMVDTVICECKAGHEKSYVVETLASGELRVVSVKNDHNLFPPELFRDLPARKMSSSIFQLLSNHPIDDAFRQKWAKLNAQTVVRQWLRMLKIINTFARQLFPTLRRFENRHRQLSFQPEKIKDYTVTEGFSLSDTFQRLRQQFTGNAVDRRVPFSEVILLVSEALVLNVYRRINRIKQILQDNADVNLSRILLLMEPQINFQDNVMLSIDTTPAPSSQQFKIFSHDAKQREVEAILDTFIQTVERMDLNSSVTNLGMFKELLKNTAITDLSFEHCDKSQERLVLEHLILSPRQHLTNLTLANTVIDDNTFSKLFQQCSQLETVDVSQCHALTIMDIIKDSAKQLKSLFARDCRNLISLCIICPTLQILVVSGCTKLSTVYKLEDKPQSLPGLALARGDSASVHSTDLDSRSDSLPVDHFMQLSQPNSSNSERRVWCDVPQLIELDVSRCRLSDESLDMMICLSLRRVHAQKCGHFAEMRAKYPKVKFSLFPYSAPSQDIEAFFNGLAKSSNFIHPHLEIEKLYASLTPSYDSIPLKSFSWESNLQPLAPALWQRLKSGLEHTHVSNVDLNRLYLTPSQMKELSQIFRHRESGVREMTLAFRNSSSGAGFCKELLSPVAQRGIESVLPALTLLDLTNTRLKHTDADQFKNLELRCLRTLILQSNDLRDSICRVLRNILEFSDTLLEHPLHLNLADNQISDHGLLDLWPLVMRNRLKVLNVSDNKTLTFPAIKLDNHRVLEAKKPTLEALILRDVKFAQSRKEQSELIKWLQQRPYVLRSLKTLDISRNSIPEKFARELITEVSMLQVLPQLSRLDLSYSGLSVNFEGDTYSKRQSDQPKLLIIHQVDSLTKQRIALNMQLQTRTVEEEGSLDGAGASYL